MYTRLYSVSSPPENTSFIHCIVIDLSLIVTSMTVTIVRGTGSAGIGSGKSCTRQGLPGTVQAG